MPSIPTRVPVIILMPALISCGKQEPPVAEIEKTILLTDQLFYDYPNVCLI
jgi:hypothetical protein